MIEKLKELTKDTAVYGISTVVGRFLQFLLVPFYTNVLDPVDYGISSNIYAYIAFISLVYSYGMDVSFQKYAANSDENEKKSLFSTTYSFLLITSVALSIIMLLSHGTMNSLMEVTDKYDYLIYYMVAIMFFDVVAVVPFANLRLERKARKFAFIKFTNIIIQIVLNFVLIFKIKMGIEAIFISNLAASVVTIFMLIPEIKRFLSFRIQKDILKKMLRFALPYLPASLGATIVQVVDRPLVLSMAGPKMCGIYQANYKLGIFMMLIVSMFQYAWQPFLLTNAKEKNAKEIFAKVLTLFLIAAALIWIVISLFINDLVTLNIFGHTFFGRKYQIGWEIVPVILLGYLFHGMYVNFTAGIYIEEKNKYLPFITGAGALINVVVNLLLIPVWGIMGAALATLASYLLMSSMIFFFAQKYYHVNYEYRKVVSILGLVLASAAVYYYLFYTGQLFMVYKLIILTSFVALLFILKVINKREIILTVNTLLRRK